jgi:hypothetical protein
VWKNRFSSERRQGIDLKTQEREDQYYPADFIHDFSIYYK